MLTTSILSHFMLCTLMIGPNSQENGRIAALRCTPAQFRTVLVAAERNDCRGDDFIVLLAIWKAENGRPGREFGVLHPRAIDTDLDTQAGWAAATVVKNRQRWSKAGKPNSFIDFLANRYCPKESDSTGNFNWKRNVKWWFEKLKRSRK